MQIHTFAAIVLVGLPCVPAAAGPARVAAVAVPEAAALKIDGEFSEAVWERAPSITDFRQRDPKDDGPPTFATDARVAYDATYLYVAVTAYDPEPAKLVALRTRRDSSS